MKRISFIITSLLLLAALTQCKKEQQVSPASDGNTVDITLNIKGGGGSRVDVNTATGTVTYESGDNIYVVSGGKYVGTLTYNGTCFGGTITDPTVGEPLYFYFLGDVTPAETLVTGVTSTCSVVISDQTEHLPVIACAPSNENYVSGSTTFTATLINQCALVKFNVTTSSEAATCIIGMKNKVTVDFSANTMTYSQEGNGVITLPAGNGERWAILLPQEAVEAGTLGSAYSEDGVYTGSCGAIPAVADNGYLTTGINVAVNIVVDSGGVPADAVCGKFTINSNGDQVYFSKANLQYNKLTAVWSFMEHQYDIVETDGQNIGEDYANQDVVSLFGWGTSGWDNGNVYYQPYNVGFWWDYYGNDTGFEYGPVVGTSNCYNLTGLYANADWGVYNAISNGGNMPGMWRTLTCQEWIYVFNHRLTQSGIRYAKAKVLDVNGIILLPDNWSENTYNLTNANSSSANFNSNTLTASQWSTLEQAGAAFLPAAGYRYGTWVSNDGFLGCYWSTSYADSDYAYSVNFSDSDLNPDYYDYRFLGLSVRLVSPVR